MVQVNKAVDGCPNIVGCLAKPCSLPFMKATKMPICGIQQFFHRLSPALNHLCHLQKGNGSCIFEVLTCTLSKLCWVSFHWKVQSYWKSQDHLQSDTWNIICHHSNRDLFHFDVKKVNLYLAAAHVPEPDVLDGGDEVGLVEVELAVVGVVLQLAGLHLLKKSGQSLKWEKP